MKGKFLIVLLLCGATGVPAQTILQEFSAVSHGGGVKVKSDLDVQATVKGSTLIGMPGQLSPGVKILSVTDNSPDGPNTYKQVSGASSSCPNGPLEIWYCENCNGGVTELQFHLSGHVHGSINGFMEVANLAPSLVLDGTGAHISNGASTKTGSEVGPSIKTTANDFIVARFFSAPEYPTGITPDAWTLKSSYAYVLNGPAGTYQPTLTGAKDGETFCMSVAAFKVAPESTAAPQAGHNQAEHNKE